MAEAATLTLAFVSTHPVDAARVLEGLPVADAAALFANLPARAAAPALGAMPTTAAARIIGALDDASALGVLAASSVQRAVAMLRRIKEPRRGALISGLSTATALASNLLLGYPEDTVGAWADPEVIALSPETAAADALARVRGDAGIEANEVYVVNGSQKLLGVVSLQSLLRAPETTSLAALLRPAGAVLPAATPLAGAAAHTGWKLNPLLPVVERGNRLIGVLHTTKLAEALVAAQARADHRHAGADVSLTGLLGRGYWDAVAGLLRVGLAALPQAPRVLPEERKV